MNTLYAGIDLGGTNISAALADAQGTIIASSKTPTVSHEGPTAVIERIATLVNALAAKVGAKPAALGIGAPGLVDVKEGVTKFFPNMPTQWRDIPVRATLSPKIGCPVHLLNDARAATLGELVFGHGKSVQTMIFFGLGTGVGGGIVVDGRLRLGPLGAAGELGHQTVLPDGPLCGCGNRGCLETLASGPAITSEGVRLFLAGNAPRLYEICAGDVSRVSPATMAKAAVAGERPVLDAIERAAGWLGIGAANLITALHPELIVIGGGVAEMGDLLLDPVRATIKRRVGMLPADSVRVEKSMLGDRAGMFGAIALAIRGGVDPG
jgi:glucokinase